MSKETTQKEDLPYPTGIFTESFSWIDRDCFVYVQDRTIRKYCINGIDNYLFDLKKKENNTIFDQVSISQKYICETYNFEIQNPTDIATEIYIYDISSEKISYIKRTSKTLKVDTCTDTIILSTSFPFLEQEIYSWNIEDENPQQYNYIEPQFEIINLADKVQFKTDDNMLFEIPKIATFVDFKINKEKTYATIQDDTGEIWIYKLK